MRDRVGSKASCLVQWSLVVVVLGLVVTCEAQCVFSDYASDATQINMDWCGNTTVNTADHTRFTSLNELSLRSNQLTTFPDLSAVGDTLKTLYLSYNQITDISDDMLIDLTALEKLGLENNQLTTFPDLSAVGDTLKRLNLSYNQITGISNDVLIDLTVLVYLNLEGNQLITFPNLSAVGGTLWSLRLSANKIRDISGDVLIDLTALEYLFLFSNQLTTFPDLSAVGGTLKILYLNDNQIKDINDEVLIDLTALEQLYLYDNQITAFPNLSAAGGMLKELFLQENQITHIDYDMLNDLTALTKLHLSNNPYLTRLPHAVLGLRSLTYFIVYDTGISHLPPILHENIATLELYIERSVDVCKCENAWLKQEGPNMAVFSYGDADCDGQLWSTMTTQDMLAKCAQQRTKETKRVTQANLVPTRMSLSPFLLHSFERALNEIRCTRKCMAAPGCVSFYWHQSSSGVGDCVLIAPGKSITVSSVPEGNLSVWTYFALT